MTELAHGSRHPRTSEVGGRPFASVCRATDRAGHRHTFAVPLLFVPDGQNDASAAACGRPLDPAFRTLRLDGQAVGLTARRHERPRRRRHPTPPRSSSRMRCLDMTTDAQGKIVPIVVEYRRLVTGRRRARPAGADDDPLRHAVPRPRLRRAQRGELLVLLDGPLATVGQGAALASASMQVRAISRAVGAVASSVAPDKVAADLEAIAAGTFDPQQWFAGLDDTKLFGVFPLGQLLPDPATLDLVTDAPNQTAELIDGRKQFTSTWRTDAAATRQGRVDRPGRAGDGRPTDAAHAGEHDVGGPGNRRGAVPHRGPRRARRRRPRRR